MKYRIIVGSGYVDVTASDYRDLAYALDRRLVGEWRNITIENIGDNEHPNCTKCDGLGHQNGCDRCHNSGVEPKFQKLPCGCEWAASDEDPKGPIFWNGFNNVAQCHMCGHVYVAQATEAELDNILMRKPNGGLE